MKGGEILNPTSILLSLASGGSTAQGATAVTPLANDGALFKTKLGDVMSSLFATKTSVTTTNAATPVDAELAKRIRTLLDQGTSLNDIIASLASSLASSVATQLGIPPDVAKQRLTEAFTAALAPTGSGPPQTNLERASSLAQRFRQMAELATRVTNGDPGQPIRTIAGTSLDAATTAKANPAPSTDTIVRDATNALVAPVSPSSASADAPPDATHARATSPAPAGDAPLVVPAPAPGDGKTVAIQSDAAIASGGDTPIGRIIARAFPGPTKPLPPTPSIGTRGGVVAGPISVPAELDAATGGKPATAPVNATKPLDDFLRAFTAALDRKDAPAVATAAAPIAMTSHDTAQTTVPFAIPVASDGVPVAPPANVSTLPQQQPHVDANAVVDQILRGINIRTTPGSSEVKLRLVPESLGDVTVKLVVSGGAVDATLTAHSTDTQSLLAGAQTQLARTLADAGLKLQSFTVGLAGAFADTRDGSNPQPRSYQTTRRTGGVAALDTDDADDASLVAAPSFGPPIYTANPVRGLNYLV